MYYKSEVFPHLMAMKSLLVSLPLLEWCLSYYVIVSSMHVLVCLHPWVTKFVNMISYKPLVGISPYLQLWFAQ